MKVGIVGCGLIGSKRAALLEPGQLLAVADADEAKAKELAAKIPGVKAYSDAVALIAHPGIEAVVVATPHRHLGPLALQAVQAGKHVLVEKPAARQASEFRPVVEEAARRGLRVKAGYNHRFHPALREAKRQLQASGEVLFLRARYGHGGRLGYEKEWRAQKEVSGGGELIDQGLHLIDLARMLMGPVESCEGLLPTLYWDMRVEDNAFLLLKHSGGRPSWLHASWTEWKNCFSLEASTRTLKVQVEGLGGSYGPEKLTIYRMKPELGPPDVEIREYPGADESWKAEWAEFEAAVREGREPEAGGADALANLEVVDELYRKAGR